MIYVISDLHGYPLENFQDLLEKAGFSDNDYCFILGDVIDRGEDGVRLLEWLMYQPNIQLILGNHEQMMLSCDFLFDEITEQTLSKLEPQQLENFLEWRENGAEPTIEGLINLEADTREDIMEYLASAPLFETVEAGGKEYILSHSGFGNYSQNKDISEYSAYELLWTRPSINERYWSDKTAVFGHTPTHYYGKEHKGRILVTDTWINIDTGAAGGLPPTLLRLDDMKTFSL